VPRGSALALCVCVCVCVCVCLLCCGCALAASGLFSYIIIPYIRITTTTATTTTTITTITTMWRPCQAAARTAVSCCSRPRPYAQQRTGVAAAAVAAQQHSISTAFVRVGLKMNGVGWCGVVVAVWVRRAWEVGLGMTPPIAPFLPPPLSPVSVSCVRFGLLSGPAPAIVSASCPAALARRGAPPPIARPSALSCSPRFHQVGEIWMIL
jgi:hypothetical protein